MTGTRPISTRTVGHDRIALAIALGGWAFEWRDGDQGAIAVQVDAALAHWTTRGLPRAIERIAGAVREKFDPVEVMNFLKTDGRAGGDEVWERFLSTGRRLVGEHHGGLPTGLPPAPSTLGPRRFEVMLCRTFQLPATVARPAHRLRMPLPVEDPSLRDLQVDIMPLRGVVDARVTQHPGRLEARFAATPHRTVVLAARCRFTARATPASPDDDLPPECAAAAELALEDRCLYLRPDEGLIQVTPRVRALAETLASDRSDARSAVGVFWDHLLDRFTCGGVHYDELAGRPATDWVLDAGWYDCQLGSALLVALCRAKSIPARIVGGHVLYRVAPFHHFWAEIWLDGTGWTPFDLLTWDLSDGGRDTAWRDYFAGALDYRMKTQILPRTFTGPMSLRLPAKWHVLARPERHGITTTFIDAETGEDVYSDTISVASAS